MRIKKQINEYANTFFQIFFTFFKRGLVFLVISNSFSICRCQFPSGALTGNLNVDHAMCVLSLNIINDKIFLLEWLWFYILALASSLSLISSAILVILPPSRKLWIRWIYVTSSNFIYAKILVWYMKPTPCPSPEICCYLGDSL